MREIRKSGSTRGGAPVLGPLLLYRLRIGDLCSQPLTEPRPKRAEQFVTFSATSDNLPYGVRSLTAAAD